LTNALNFAKTKINISKEDTNIIFHSRKSLLFNKNHTWMKKGGDLFDVTMGAFDGAEICELVGIYMLQKISIHYNIANVGLYRDDGLAAFKNTSGPGLERIKKKLQSIFKENDLELVIECNKKVVDYLDVTFNLNNGSFKPYHKPDHTIQYINVQSNHPPNIIKQIPKTIEKRLSDHSLNEATFNEAAPIYEKALKDSGYETKLKYNPQKPKNANNRKRNIIWFNPPFSKNVETKIGNRFLKLVDKHFPNEHKLHKIFNRNNVKVSYSCTKNMKAVINSHNSQILNNIETNQGMRTCNCLRKNQCPLNGNCLISNSIYEATVTSDKPDYQDKVYIGLAETTFKKRYSNHKKSFNAEKYSNETELSKEVWELKNSNYTQAIKWRTIKQCAPFNRNTLKCNLCLSEKLTIALYPKENILNKRTELISKCRHVNKHMLIRHDSKD
jgi:predicted GIY-YIG superfamily endonuclease